MSENKSNNSSKDPLLNPDDDGIIVEVLVDEPPLQDSLNEVEFGAFTGGTIGGSGSGSGLGSRRITWTSFITR